MAFFCQLFVSTDECLWMTTLPDIATLSHHSDIYGRHKLLNNLTLLVHGDSNGNDIFRCYLVNMFYTYVTENQRVMNTNYYTVSL